MTKLRNLLMAGAALTLAAGALATTAQAQEFQPKTAGTILLNVRLTDVSPKAGDPILTAAGAGTTLSADVNDSVVPTVGVSYFFTDNVAIEAIAGTSHHTVKATGPGTNVKVHETWVLPPVVTLQYHFAPAAKVSPYVGAGVNYMIFYGDKDLNGFKVKLKDGFGYALQAGVDIATTGKYSVNLDVKKVFFDTKASINGGTLKSKVNLDPWVISAGVGYKF